MYELANPDLTSELTKEKAKLICDKLLCNKPFLAARVVMEIRKSAKL